MADASPTPIAGVLYRRLWRWHFYAGLCVLPFVTVLALSGTVFLFKPQIERWEERAFRGLPAGGVPASRQVEIAMAANPGAHFHSYRLPERPDDAAMVHLVMPGGDSMRDVFVSPRGEIVGSLDTATRIVEIARRVHGQLLMGQRGSWLVELVACWAIVMLVTGLYLWWPRGRGAAGVLWPRRRSLLRDLHTVTGFWVSAFAMVLLLTGLPWTDVWGNALNAVRSELGWVKGVPQWRIDGGGTAAGGHAGHDHDAMHVEHGAAPGLATLDHIVARTVGEPLAFPTMVLAPGATLFGPASADWVATSLVQNRPLGMSITFDAATGEERSREAFSQRHVIDRVIGYGQAWHEGALLGALNQAAGLVTAAALVTMAITGFVMWRQRRPANALGAPPLPADRRQPVVVTVAILVLAAFLPLLAASLLVLWLVDLALPRVSPAAAAWLGITNANKELP